VSTANSPRTIRYQAIASALRERVGSGEFAAGALLPSEADLSHEFAASRVTVRRALEVLRADGLLDSRQGFGWFVASAPIRQTLGRLATIEAQMAESGIRPERRILEFAFVTANAHIGDVLQAQQVLRVKRLNLADGAPFAVVTVWCPAELGQNFSRLDVERAPFYELLDIPLRGATQTIGADAVSPPARATDRRRRARPNRRRSSGSPRAGPRRAARRTGAARRPRATASVPTRPGTTP